MKFGYARISSSTQNLTMQVEDLKRDGCSKIYYDTESGIINQRSGLGEMMYIAKPGDEIVVWKLDRLSRDPGFIFEFIAKCKDRNLTLRSLSNDINTDTPEGILTTRIHSSVAEYERGIIRKRIQNGILNAKRSGVKFGRPYKLTETQQSALIALHREGFSPDHLSKTFGLSIRSVFRYFQKARSEV